MKSALTSLLVAAVLSSAAHANTPFAATKAPVDVTLFVMSRCPDAIRCESTFSEVFKSKSLPEINPTLSFIGALDEYTSTHWSTMPSVQSSSLTLTTTTTVTSTVTCKHGPLECAGNIQQLCFRNLFLNDWRVWYAFVIGSNSWEPRRIGEEAYALQVAERILKNLEPWSDNAPQDPDPTINGIWGTKAEDWTSFPYDATRSVEYILQDSFADEKMTPQSSLTDPDPGSPTLREFQTCFQGPQGFEFLVQSVQNTIDHGVTTSCTVFIDNKKRCVVDGGVWRECPGGHSIPDFVRSITEAANSFRFYLTSRIFRL
ncbi:hypothetical protein EMPS_08645 [Entomortierella parvispora]|uniref:Uncharacterized protein n=1 Tax=Entomortierella parvispora TaxID=205924 RepID=A0A9P3LZA3_9FUNG|nr:hypothetical protein EMPS_08645 [Entomortierella parvispora]